MLVVRPAHASTKPRRCSKNGKKFEKELTSFDDAYWHGQDVNTNEYMALVYRAAAYGIDTGKLPPLPNVSRFRV